PKVGSDSSFIPYNLRKAFGMTTIEHKNAVYAYYFYRLMQRAENITLLYNTSTDGLNRGEWSRFMLQFLIEYPHAISREYLDSGQSPQKNHEIVVSKTAEIMRRLQNRFDIRVNSKAKFTPSALNTYIDCRLKFYFRYVAGLKPKEEVSSEIDSAAFGSIFHRSAELVYKELSAISKLIKKEDIEQLLHNETRLQSFVDAAFKELFFKVAKDEKPEYNGIQLINSNVITSYLKQLLTKDLLYTPFSMEAMEKEVTEDIEIQTPKGIIKSRIGGIIDRMDSKGDILRIVDYKTGGTPKSLSTIDSLLEPSENRPNYIFQTFVYAAIMSRKQALKVSPALLYIHRATADNYSPVIEIGESHQSKLPIDDFSQYEEEFRELLNKLLEEIFNPEEKFAQTDITKSCEYCDFKTLCNR
ncbi:MAG: PD-(D/E)XK nuclease family protein, partial [Bacteroidaceae bacterium]